MSIPDRNQSGVRRNKRFVALCGYCFPDAFDVDVTGGAAGLIGPGKRFAEDPDSGRQDNGIVLDALNLQ